MGIWKYGGYLGPLTKGNIRATSIQYTAGGGRLDCALVVRFTLAGIVVC